jgi:hypothetical protein
MAKVLLNMKSPASRAHDCSWHIAIFFCNAKFGGYGGIADIDQAAPIQHPILRAKHESVVLRNVALNRSRPRRIGGKILIFRNYS